MSDISDLGQNTSDIDDITALQSILLKDERPRLESAE